MRLLEFAASIETQGTEKLYRGRAELEKTEL
jgi:hypothetical protein